MGSTWGTMFPLVAFILTGLFGESAAEVFTVQQHIPSMCGPQAGEVKHRQNNLFCEEELAVNI